MKPTRWICIAALVGAAALLAAGCGSAEESGAGSGSQTGSEPAELTWATGAEDVVVDVDYGVGYVPLEYAVGQEPEFRLYGDGTVVVPAPGDDGRARITAFDTYRLTSEGVRAVLAAAAGAGLLGPELDYGRPEVTDSPTTVVTVNVDGRTFSQSAYALGFVYEGETGVTPVQEDRREALSEFVELVDGLPEQQPDLLVAPPEPYEPAAIEALALAQAEGYQTLEWPGPPLSEAPADTDGDRCVVIRGAELGDVERALEPISSLPPINWRSGGSLWTVGFRVVLPGEQPCLQEP